MEGADYGTLGSSEKQTVQSERGSEVSNVGELQFYQSIWG